MNASIIIILLVETKINTATAPTAMGYSLILGIIVVCVYLFVEQLTSYSYNIYNEVDAYFEEVRHYKIIYQIASIFHPCLHEDE